MLNANEAIKKLLEGNQRFANNESIHPNRCQEARLRLIDKQNPFAVIISCSDSRVPIEIIFDAGLGDLFIIRTAGHSISTATLGSIEYAIKYLGVKLVMVLGHDNCGAIKSAMCNKKIETLPPNLKSIIKTFTPAVEAAKKDCLEDDSQILNKAIKYNVLNTINYLSTIEPVIATNVRENKVEIIGGNYSLTTGKVEFFE